MKKKKIAKQEQNSNQKNNNRQNKTQEIEKINGNGELSPSLLFLCFLLALKQYFARFGSILLDLLLVT